MCLHLWRSGDFTYGPFSPLLDRVQGAAKTAALTAELARVRSAMRGRDGGTLLRTPPPPPAGPTTQASSLVASVESDVSLAWRAVRALTDSDIVGLHAVIEARMAGAIDRGG